MYYITHLPSLTVEKFAFFVKWPLVAHTPLDVPREKGPEMF